MGKRKSLHDDDDDDELEDEAEFTDDSDKPVKQVAKKSKSKKKKRDDDSDEEEESSPKSPPLPKKKSAPNLFANASGSLSKDNEGNSYIDLGKRKRATVRGFKGTTYVDIREFYLDKKDDSEKPGKKGISLGEEQWENLKKNMDTIDQMFKDAGKKK